MYRLYIANKNYSSWSLRPWLLLKALDIPFEEELMVFEPGSNLDRFRAFSPNGRVPCLYDGETVVWESLSIVEYLAERHAGVWPEDAPARVWARSAASEMHAGFGELRNQCPMCCGVRVEMHRIDAGLQSDVDRINELWAEGLDRFGGPYLAGAAFTAVDAFFAPVAFRYQSFGLPLQGGARRYADDLLRYPWMQNWYDAGLAESWREPGHEDDISAAGKVTADYRAR